MAAKPEINLSIFAPCFDAKNEPKYNPIITIVIDEEVNNNIV